MTFENRNNVTLINRKAIATIEEAKRKLQEAIVLVNSTSIHTHSIHLLRRSIQTVSHIQSQLEK